MAKLGFYLLVLFSILTLGMPSKLLGGFTKEKGGVGSVDLSENAPSRDTPTKLREVWLRFHEDNLCQQVDAAFVFHKSKMDVQVNVEGDQSYKKLFEMLEPLRNSYQIELHAVRTPLDKEPSNINYPPPSFWVNSKLLQYLRDSFIQDTGVFDKKWLPVAAPPLMLKGRLLMFAEDTLDYSRKMERYAAHLPALVRTAFDPTATPDLRNRALAICRTHARKLEKYAKKLNGNLSMALPKASQKARQNSRPEEPIIAEMSPIDSAVQLANEAQGIALHVHGFIYSQHLTVGLADLRNPSVLQSLKKVQKKAAEFRNAIS